jgi:Fe(II)/alpha-ketoglutarate-dependent arginine beta-hydroxylase
MRRLDLTERESRAVADLADQLLAAGGREWDPPAMAEDVSVGATRLPDRLREFLARIRAEESDVTVVGGLPISEELTPTPTGWEKAAKTGAGRREEMVLLLTGSALGEPFGWANQQDGRIVHDVCPVPGMERSLTSASSEAALSLHTEDIFHPCRGDYVSLLCLRNPDAVGTTFVRIAGLPLPAELAAVLAEHRFRFYPDDSHVGTILPRPGDNRLAGRANEIGRVLFGPADDPYLRFDIDFMAPLDDDAAEAVRAMHGILRASVENVVMRPGDAVFLDNYRVVHGREPFVPRYDGKDRWLKRLNLIRDVRRIYATSDRRSRILA